MKLLRLILAASAIAVVAQAGDRRLTLFEQATVAGTKLAPGDYKVQVDGDKVKIYSTKQSVETTAKVETNGEKYSNTSVVYDNRDGRYRVTEIWLGGTSTKLVLGN
ncbi:MAG: hypothetical protein JWO19_2023 [Bryobacterales bacterium]|jgi:hypothetical protein|nr:hypothetical protein [Bryobacterales bacterium]